MFIIDSPEDNARVLIISDIHIPYAVPQALEQVWRFIGLYNPTRIIIAGDLVDFYHASKFLKHPTYGYTLKEEIQQAKEFLQLLRRKVDVRIDFICGNHDYRLEQFVLRQTPELAGLPQLALPELLELDSLNIIWHPVKSFATSFVDNWIDVNGVHIGHFHRANQGSGMTVRNLMTKREGSYVQGHAHRAGLIWRRNIDGEQHFGMENLCLYDLKLAPYISDPDWQMGFSTITDGAPELILLREDYSFIWGGEIYKYQK